MGYWASDGYHEGTMGYTAENGEWVEATDTSTDTSYEDLVSQITDTLNGLTSTTGTEGTSTYTTWEDYLKTINEDLYNQLKDGLTTGNTYTSPTVDYTAGDLSIDPNSLGSTSAIDTGSLGTVGAIDTSSLPYLTTGQGLYDAYRSQGLNEVSSQYDKAKQEAGNTYFGNQYAYDNAIKNLSSDEALAASGSTATSYANAEAANTSAQTANLSSMLQALTANQGAEQANQSTALGAATSNQSAQQSDLANQLAILLGNQNSSAQQESNQLNADTTNAGFQQSTNNLNQSTQTDYYQMLMDLLKNV